MKKIFSVLLSALLCVSVAASDTSISTGYIDNTGTFMEEEYGIVFDALEESDSNVVPCSGSGGPGGEGEMP